MAAASSIILKAREPQIRTAVFADRAGILELQRLSLRTLGREFYGDTEIESYLRHAPTLEDYLLEDGTYFVAHVGERLAGCGGWSLRLPAYSAVTADALGTEFPLPRIRAMFVHPEFARCGIGRHLLADIESAILEAGHGEIRIDATLGGLPLYERCGYRRFGHTLAVLPDGSRMRFVRLHKRFYP
jgi:GNAT superfamily N-acetyltransferase